MPAVCLILAALLVQGCGSEDPSPPGAWGAKATNTLVTVSLANTPALLNACSASGVDAHAAISTRTVNLGLPPNALTVTRYTLAFSSADPLAPALAGGAFGASVALPVADVALSFVNAAHLDAFRAQAGAGGPVSGAYTVTYVLSGLDLYGSSFGVTSRADFMLALPGPCPLLVAPAAVSVTGIMNNDVDPTDDVTFHISGGTAPYTVYTDNATVVAAPGVLTAGLTAFTVDPDRVFADTLVTLTVVDSLGASDAVLLLVRP
jgi:hypothetical protein